MSLREHLLVPIGVAALMCWLVTRVDSLSSTPVPSKRGLRRLQLMPCSIRSSTGSCSRNPDSRNEFAESLSGTKSGLCRLGPETLREGPLIQELVAEARTAIGATVSQYVLRSLLALPFLLAVGFATAALSLMLAERFGWTAAYSTIAVFFCALGMMASFVARGGMGHLRRRQSNTHTPVSFPRRALSAGSAFLNVLLALGLGLVLALNEATSRSMALGDQQSVATLRSAND